MVTLNKCLIGYHGKPLLPPLDWHIKPGELWGLAGRNGCGKSTLLQTILGLIPALDGTISIMSSVKHHLGYIPQFFQIEPSAPITVKELIGWGKLGKGLRKQPGPSTYGDDIISHLGLSDLLSQPFQTLSGGQQQQVLIARILLSDYQFACLDEPTASMDSQAEAKVFAELFSFVKRSSTALVIISHDINLLVKYVDHLLFLDSETAAIIQGETQFVTQSELFQHRFGYI